MDLALLRTFVAVHRAGSFTRAAALLGLSQPAVTSQIRALERQVGRPLFLRQARGVTPTSLGEELAHKAAPHLDALAEIAEGGVATGDGPARTLHLTGPPEFLAERALPALSGLDKGEGPDFGIRATFGTAQESLEGLAAGHHDLAISTVRPRGGLLTATALCDEELVLVAAPTWADRLPVERLGGGPAPVPGRAQPLPFVDCHESLPLVARYWTAVFDALPPGPGAVIVPDLRAVLGCVLAGAGLAVLPRYLCAGPLAEGRLRLLLNPAVAPLRTYFLVTRTGTLALPHLSRTHDRLLRAAADWG
ncbi:MULTISPECIES: LysR family transcriptional regulator [unclassified Streptomyces]|uniref:LysR family transcriptional regulator n=1 Tax=unclassified Streptomyces TaxID=2593676 RepID=UPI0023B98151|nr:LysR family transcriptional regulator [Streptomyces sp. AM 3-1-1]WEH28591.1 LysR family transcriptional regulator [Streptomyces sp. AM 3-1-1]